GGGPDLALPGLARLGDAAGPEVRGRVLAAVVDGGPPCRNLLALLGGSAALADWLVAHPDDVDVVLRPRNGVAADPETMRTLLLEAVGADPRTDVPAAGGAAVAGLPGPMRAR